MMHNGNFWIAILLTTLAGLSTAVGSAVAFFAGPRNYRFLSWGTGFAAGVMIYISFIELMEEGLEMAEEFFNAGAAGWIITGAFFVGILIMFIIDQLVPHEQNPHEARSEEDLAEVGRHSHGPGAVAMSDTSKLERTGVMTALAVAIHNFPEGLVTFLAALQDPALGVAIAIAIALHNIPEGISISVPLYYATGSRRRAFTWSALSGLAEPLGALVGYVLLRPFLTPGVMGIVFAGIAGIMVYIALDELLPTSREYSRGHDSLFGLLGGMFVMAVSLLLLG